MSPPKSQYHNYSIPLPSPSSSSSGTDSSFPCGRSQAPSRASSVECMGNASANVHASSESNNGAQSLTCKNLKVLQKRFPGHKSRQRTLDFRVWDWKKLDLREGYVREEEDEEDYEKELAEGEGIATGREKISQECPAKKHTINPIANHMPSGTGHRTLYPMQDTLPMIRHFDDSPQRLDPVTGETLRDRYAREEREMWTGNPEKEETVREYWERWGRETFAKKEAEGEDDGENASLIASSPTLPALSPNIEKGDRSFDTNETLRERFTRTGREEDGLEPTSSSAAPTLTPTPPLIYTPIPTTHPIAVTPEKGTKASGPSFLERSLANQLPFPLPRVQAKIHTSPDFKSDLHSKRIRKSRRKLNEKDDQNAVHVPEAKGECRARPQRHVRFEEAARDAEKGFTSGKSDERIPTPTKLKSASSASPEVIPTFGAIPPPHRVSAPLIPAGTGNTTKAIPHGTAFLERSFANTILAQNLVTRPLPPMHGHAYTSSKPLGGEDGNEGHERKETGSGSDQDKIANESKARPPKHVMFSESTKLEDGGARKYRKEVKADIADKGKKVLRTNNVTGNEKRSNADDDADVWIDVAREFAGEDVEWEH